MQQGIHAISPEIDTYGKDYDGDGYVTALKNCGGTMMSLVGSILRRGLRMTIQSSAMSKLEVGAATPPSAIG